MNNIVVCYKWVVDEQDITVDQDGSLKMRNPAYKVSLYDRNAIEAAVTLAEQTGGSCIALTAGGKDCVKSRKEALCTGPAEGRAVVDDALEGADSLVTANALSAAIEKIGNVDIVLCGEGSGDDYAQQVGPRIAAQLGVPFIGYASSIECEGDQVVIKRESSDGFEVLKGQVPVVVSMAGDCNTPRIAGIKDVLGAGKKPFEEWSPSDLGLDGQSVSSKLVRGDVTGNLPDRKKIVVNGSAEEIAAELVKNLVADGVLG